MSFTQKPIVVPLVVPALILIASAMLLPVAADLSSLPRLGLIQVPYYLLALVSLLGLFLNRSREAGAAMFLVVVYYCIQRELQLPLELERPGNVYFLLCLMVPIGIIALAAMPECRTLEFWGLAALLLAPILFVIGIRVLEQVLGSGESLNALWLPRSDAPTILSTQAFYLFGAAILFCLIMFIVRQNAAEAGILFSAIFAFATLNWLYIPMISTVMILAAGLALFVGVISSLLRMLYHDELTGLADRKALNKDMLRLNEGDILVMVDIDKFKNLNDSYGHDTGDEVLKLVSALIDETGERSHAYRYGGEEFTLLFRHRDPDKALAAMQSVREKIAAYPIVIRVRAQRPKKQKHGAAYRNNTEAALRNKKAIRTSVSMGAVILRAEEHPMEALKRADEQLYKAKKTGRNRVCTDFH